MTAGKEDVVITKNRELEEQIAQTKEKVVVLNQMQEKGKKISVRVLAIEIKELSMEFKATAEMIGRMIVENKRKEPKDNSLMQRRNINENRGTHEK